MTLIPITERTQYCIVDCGKETCQCKPTKKIQVGKELTSMQILIEEIESLADKFQPNTDAKRIYLGLRDKIINMNLLQKEQEQIEQAFSDGFDDGENYDREIDERILSKDYCQSKYGGK